MKKKLKKSKSKKMIIKKCGLEKEVIETKLRFARKNGMKYKRFLLNRAWELSEEEIVDLNNKINDYIEKQDSELHLIKLKTGILKEEIVARKFLVNKYGITDKTYFDRNLYLLSSKKFDEYLGYLRKCKEIEKMNDEFYLELAQKVTGWSMEKAKKEMDEAKEKGIDYKHFVSKGAYKSENIESIANFLKADKKRIRKNTKEYIKRICEKTKWSIEKVEFETRKAKSVSECSYEDYLGFKFYKKSPRKQASYVTLKNFDRLRNKYNEYYSTRDNFDIKSNFNKVFKDYIKRRWFTNDNLTFEAFKKEIKGLKKIIVKPLSSTCGVGIKCFECNISEKNDKKTYEFIMSIGKAIIEQYIVQSKEMLEFCPTSVNTVRVTTIVHNGKCELVSSLFRIGNGDVVDNFHANGVAANVDVKTGIVDTHAIDVNNNIHKRSPMTNKKIKGFHIPNWDQIVKLCNEIAFVVEGSKLIGWDFAITENGIDLIEGNTGAYYVVQLAKSMQNKGLKSTMIDKYL
ncbi:MAG: hypothetical protein IJY25_01335 [Bacilli bacterium]|nr:hypothetical protein [Bacilli bacterium]